MRVSWLFVAMAVLSFGGKAIADDSQVSVPADIEFLEFLGRWETKDGEWVDPLSLGADSSLTRDSEAMKGDRLISGEEDLIYSEDDDPFSPKKGRPSIGERDEDD